MIVYQHINFAFGYVNKGIFLDTYGNVYSYDFSIRNDKVNPKDHLIDKLKMVQEHTDPTEKVDLSVVQEMIDSGRKIDPNSEVDTKSNAMDAGGSTFYFHNVETGELILCYSSGCEIKKRMDTNAEKVTELAKNALMDAMNIQSAPILYTTDGMRIKSMECESLKKEEKYVLFTEEQLKLLEERSGYQITSILEGLEPNKRGEDIFFVQFIKASSKEEAFVASAFLQDQDRFEFILSDDTTKSDDSKEATVEGVCLVTAFPSFLLDHKDLQYQNFEKSGWMTLDEGDYNRDPEVHRGYAYGMNEEKVEELREEYHMNDFKGNYIDNFEDYKKFLSDCDQYQLITEDGQTIQQVLEKEYQPDFEQVDLCIVLHRKEPKQAYQMDPMQITYNEIAIGVNLTPEFTQTGVVEGLQGSVAFAFIPKRYLTMVEIFNVD